MRKKILIALAFICVIGILTMTIAGFYDKGEPDEGYIEYHFRNNALLTEHYNKHGKEMGFKSKEEYEKAASDVANSKEALHKKEKEDNDDVYYIEATNEFVIISTDGYIRTYFKPDSGIKYYNKQ